MQRSLFSAGCVKTLQCFQLLFSQPGSAEAHCSGGCDGQTVSALL